MALLEAFLAIGLASVAKAPPPAADVPALTRAEDVAALVRAGTAVGVVSGRSITDPPGHKRFQRLQQVRTAVEQAARKKGLQRRAGS